MTPEERFERHERWLEQHDRMMADHDRGMAEHERRMAEHERTMQRIENLGERTDARMNRAIRLAVQEARAERVRRTKANAEFDQKMTQLAAAQVVTEEKLQNLQASMQAFIDSLRRGGNGHT